MDKYVVFRNDGYILVTDELWRAKAAILKYRRMTYKKRERWLRQHGIVMSTDEILERLPWIIEKYCDSAVHGVMNVKEAVRCVRKAFDELADDLLLELLRMSISKERIERRPRERKPIRRVWYKRHPALRRARTLSEKPLIHEFRDTVWVVLDEYNAISFAKEFLAMVKEDPVKATEIAAEYFSLTSWLREDFLKLDLTSCELDVCRKLRALQVYLQVA